MHIEKQKFTKTTNTTRMAIKRGKETRDTENCFGEGTEGRNDGGPKQLIWIAVT